MKSIFTLLLVIVCCSVQRATATIRTFQFTGIITSSGISGVSVGDPFVATLSYDDAQIPFYAGNGYSNYDAFTYTLTVAGQTFVKQVGTYIQVYNGNQNLGDIGDRFHISGGPFPHLNLRLGDASGTALSSTALPSSLPLSSFVYDHVVIWEQTPTQLFIGNITSCATNPIVTTNANAGPGSLRQAILDACPGSTITFAPSLNGQTITLAGELPEINKNLTITGPGANLLTISGNNNSRIFIIRNPAAVTTLNNITLSDANNNVPLGDNTGGAIKNYGTLVVNNCILSNNTAEGGGAIYSSGKLDLNNSTVSGNKAVVGGGIYNAASELAITITNSIISDNSATNGAGGGIYNGSADNILVVINSTIVNNKTVGGGGGIISNGAVSITNSTISNNSAGALSGGGIWNAAPGTLTILNTIVAGNKSGGVTGVDFLGQATSQGYNLIGKTDGSSGWVATDLLGTNGLPLDPLLGSLADNGGPTQTMALLPGSPAINAGTNTGAPATDQRGITRPQQSTTDIGAFESQGFNINVSSGNNQSTIVNTDFASHLLLSVTSAYGEPVDGGKVQFIAPASDASLTMRVINATIAGNNANSGTITANAIAGTYDVIATTAGANTAINFTLTNQAVVVPKLTTSINGVIVNANNDGVDDNGTFAVCYKTNNILFNSFTDQDGLVDPLLKVYQAYTASNVTVPFCNNCWTSMAAFTGHTGTAALINPASPGTLTMQFKSWIDTDDDGIVDPSEPASDWTVYTIAVSQGITCPADITVNSLPILCGTFVTYPPVTSPPGSCGGAITYSKPSGSYFPVGTTTVTVTTTGGAACSFKVTVKDVQKPVIVCPSNITVNAASNSCSKVVNFSVTAIDNCPGLTVTSVPASGTAFPAGTTTVTVTATDASGNTTNSSFTVTVKETVKPVITCPGNITVNTSANQCNATVNPGIATATDNCSAVTITGKRSDNKPLTASYPTGTTTITWKATDASGNHSSCQQKITVNDNVPPVISNVSTSSSVLWPANHSMKTITVNYTSTDNCSNDCSGNCSLSVTSNEPISGTGNGDLSPDWQIIDNHKVKLRAERKATGTGRIYTIKITCKDGNNNTSTQTVTVSVPLTAPGTNTRSIEADPLLITKEASNKEDNSKENDTKEYNSKKDNSKEPIEELTAKLTVRVSPNPSGYNFNLAVKSSKKEAIEIRIFDMTGRLVKQMRAANAGTIRFGDDLMQGTYLVEVRQGNEKQVVKVMKL